MEEAEDLQQVLAAYHALRQASQAAQAAVERPLAGRLTPSQFGVLSALEGSGPLSQRQLAQAIGRTSSNLTTVVAHLERDGLVKRESHPTDRRQLLVSLTLVGQLLIRGLEPQHAAGIARLLGTLGHDELAQLTALCLKVSAAATNAVTERAD